MDKLELFLNENKSKRKNITFPVSESFRDDKGEVIFWELRPVSTDEDADIRNDCTVYDDEGCHTDMAKYIRRLVSSSVVYPNLFDAKLQDSYNVKTPERLLTAMVDSPGEFARLVSKVNELNGFTSPESDVAAAKN